jgi:hypothetical protein
MCLNPEPYRRLRHFAQRKATIRGHVVWQPALNPINFDRSHCCTHPPECTTQQDMHTTSGATAT